MSTARNKKNQNDLVTRIAQRHKQSNLIWDQVFPVIPVSSDFNETVEFGKEHLKIHNTKRGNKSDIQVAPTDDWTYTEVILEEHSIAFEIDERELKNSSIPNLQRQYAQDCAESLQTEKEKKVADAVFTAANYASGEKETLAGTDQWSDKDDADPITQLNDGISTVRTAIGTDPNTLILGAASFHALKTVDKVEEYLKYTGAILTEEVLAKILGIERVIVGKSVYYDEANDAMTDIWDDKALLCYTNLASNPQKNQPSIGYMFQEQGMPIGLSYDSSNSGVVKTVAARDNYAEKLLWSASGYLFSDTVA